MLSYPDAYEVGIATSGAADPLYARSTTARRRRSSAPTARGPTWALRCARPASRCGRSRSYRPVRDADLWGITLQHELTYTNVLEMIDLAGVPLHAADRGEGDPIVLGGGPCSGEPAADGAVSSTPSSSARPRRGWARSSRRWARRRAPSGSTISPRVPGVWVPRRSRGPVVRQVFTGFAAVAAGDRAARAPARGRARPRRHRDHARLHGRLSLLPGRHAGTGRCASARSTWSSTRRWRRLRSTGCDEVSLMSLSSCDYSGIEAAVEGIRAAAPGVRVSLPSLRVDSAAIVLARLGDRPARHGHARPRGRVRSVCATRSTRASPRSSSTPP